jgi:ABC-type transport system involved in multi-copper enzyme maturation permease subunit
VKQVAAMPRLLPSAARVFDMSLGQMLWSRRSIFLGLLVAAPVCLSIAVRILAQNVFGGLPYVNGVRVGGPAVFGVIIWLLYIRFIVPVLGVFYGTAFIADEIDDKTITYLFCRPIPRSAVVLGKYFAYLTCTLLLVLPSVVLVYFLVGTMGGRIGVGFPALVQDLGILALGLAAYGAFFALVGAWLKRPLVAGLVFALGWEPAVLLFPGYLKRLTIAYYLQALVPHAMPQDSAVSVLMQVFRDTPSAAGSLAALLLISAGALFLAGRLVESREYVLEQ